MFYGEQREVFIDLLITLLIGRTMERVNCSMILYPAEDKKREQKRVRYSSMVGSASLRVVHVSFKLRESAILVVWLDIFIEVQANYCLALRRVAAQQQLENRVHLARAHAQKHPKLRLGVF